MYEAQKQQALLESQVSFESAKSQFEIQRMEREGQIKQMLMEQEFNYNMQLAQAKVSSEEQKIQEIEDRKDNRTKLQATQQSEMIQQRQEDGLPINFESSGNDVLNGDIANLGGKEKPLWTKSKHLAYSN